MEDDVVLVADVLVERAGQSVYAYAIPEELAEVIRPGALVNIPLRQRKIQGFVQTKERRPRPDYKLRNVSLPKRSVQLPDHLMKLADWSSRYYRCALLQMLLTMVPSPVRKGIELQQTRILEKQSIDETAKQSLSKRQREIYEALSFEPLTMKEACLSCACSAATIEKLIQADAVQVRYESGIKERQLHVDAEDHQLNQEQQQAYLQVLESLEQQVFRTYLLYGVTGSGKTLVYMELAKHCIERQQQVLILLPEIALTPQLAARFRRKFDRVSIWHSGFTDGERAAAWHAAAQGEIDLVIGTRSALFAPLPHIGLIVVDEEHDQSYKQDSTPRYQGRDLAIVYAQQLGVPVVLGSATPSCESIQNVRQGKYTVLQLKERPSGSALPSARVIDMREECKTQHKQAVLSEALLDALRACKDNEQQSIVLLNRRGWSPTVSCPRCGFVCECNECDISMTWHKAQDVLRCHLCGKEARLPKECPSCEFPEMAHRGIGTERLAAVIQEAIPTLRICRMDADTISKRQGHAEIIQAFGRGDADCLLGTQMVAKGLNFPRVTLVGVVAADQGLAAPDFRAAERTYQLIAQVAGRAGRAEQPGQVIVQAYDPQADAIDCALHNRPKSFFDAELQLRERYRYPPFFALMRILWRSENAQLVQQLAIQQTNAIKGLGASVSILGPSPAGIAYVKGQYRWHTLIKGESRQQIQQLIKAINKSHILDSPKEVACLIDVDPYEFS